MGDVTTALFALRDGGVSLRILPDGRLWASPRRRLTPEVRGLIQEHRDGLVRLLRDEALAALDQRFRTAPAIDYCPGCGRETLWRSEDEPHDGLCEDCGTPVVPSILPPSPEFPATPGHMTDCDCADCIPRDGSS